MNHGDFVAQLDSVIFELDSCIQHNEDLLETLNIYANEAEANASTAHGPANLFFKEYRVSRPPIPKNHHALQKGEFARRNLQPLTLSVSWSDHEISVLHDSLMQIYDDLDVAL